MVSIKLYPSRNISICLFSRPRPMKVACEVVLPECINYYKFSAKSDVWSWSVNVEAASSRSHIGELLVLHFLIIRPSDT